MAVVLMAGAPTKGLAQADPSQTPIPSLELEQADVREALRQLFRSVNVSYSISPDVQGTVTLSLRNVTFETALRNILNQVDATYRVEGGVFQIIRREALTPDITQGQDLTAPAATKPVRRLKIQRADPAYIIMMLNGGSTPGNARPEMSTLMGGGFGGGFGGGGFGGGGFGGGLGGFGGGFGGGGLGGFGGFGGGGLGGFGGGGFGGFGGGGFGGMGGGGFGGFGGGGFR
ncbi:MAG: secretin and TonB N-terminal domain-containing protein [Fimbriimonadaceae bacterium]